MTKKTVNKASNEFIVGKHNISWVGSLFTEWFGEMEFLPIAEASLKVQKLPRPMNDAEIIAELKPEPVGLPELLFAMEHSDDMLKNGYANTLYIKDNSGVLRSVCVFWGGGGWNVYARGVSGPSAWGGGGQVFSRNSALTPSGSSPDTQTLRPSVPLRKETSRQALTRIADALEVIATKLK